MRDPLAYLLTWTTYGSWLPGDERGSFARGGKFVEPDVRLREDARERMTEEPLLLCPDMRAACETAIRRVATHRGWTTHAVSARTNHVHVVLTADRPPKRVAADLKSWCTRDLKEAFDPGRKRWWTERGSVRLLFDDDAVEAAVVYVRDGQDRKPEA